MKIFTFFTMLFFAFLFKANAQIPNSGFEDWDTYPNYLEPVDFLTPNSYASTGFYPVTQSSDHYPSDIGSYSIRIENNISIPNIDGFGIVLQNATTLADGPLPYFPISGHPQSLTGYFKYSPQDGDTMRVIALLFKNGIPVSVNAFISGDTTLEWAPFTIDFPAYVSADSGSILMAAYNANGHPPQYTPHGNSVLYVDNLNFDNLITSTQSTIAEKNLFSFYPNPASGLVFLNTEMTGNSEKTLSICNIIGELVITEKLKSSHEKIDIGDLNCGVYILEIKSSESSETKKLIVQ